jgi:hypothetical protein
VEGKHVGALVTLELPEDSPQLTLPWIITFGPLEDDDSWEPIVCGPYERAHAIALAETVVADEELMAVVEPVLPHTTVDQIRKDIEEAKAAGGAGEDVDEEDEDFEFDESELDVAVDEDFEDEDLEEVEPSPAPSAEEIKAGFARIAAKLASS